MSSHVRKKPSIFNRLYLLWFLSTKKLRIVSGLVISVGAFGLMLVRSYYLALPFWVLLGSLIVGLAVVVQGMFRGSEDLDSASLVPEPYLGAAFETFLTNVKLPAELQRAGYDVLAGGIAKNLINELPFEGASAISTRINQVFWNLSAQGSFTFDARASRETHWLKRRINGFAKWKPPGISRGLQYPILKSRNNPKLANDEKIRLREDLFFIAPTDPILIERTDYLADVATGQATGVRFLDTTGAIHYNGLDFAYENGEDGWCLRTSKSSHCSNQMGVSTLAVAVSEVEHLSTRVLQGHVFIVIQGKDNLQSAGLLAPSGSGSLDWSDYIEDGGKFVCEGMMRELLEETVGGKLKKILDRGRTYTLLTGYGRMLHRGGKPEFYGLTVMPRKKHEKGIHRSEKTFVAGFDDIEVSPLTAAGLAKALEVYRIENAQRLSHPLFVALRFAEDYLQARAVEFDAIVQEVGAFWRAGNK